MTATGDGKRKQVTKREAVIAQLVNKSASAELRAKMLIDMLREVEKGRTRRPSLTDLERRVGPALAAGPGSICC